MKIKSVPIIQNFKLECDPEGIADFTVCQARNSQDILRNEVVGRVTRLMDVSDGRPRLQFDQNDLRLYAREVYLTLSAVSGVKNEKDEEVFKSEKDPDGIYRVNEAMSEEEFLNAWDKLPKEAREEIHTRVREVNPQWGKPVPSSAT